MKLYYSTTSPYARKVRVTIAELGLGAQVEMEVASPLAGDVVPNPLNKIPLLELDDGTALMDSPVICAWLEDFAGLSGVRDDAYWRDQRTVALSDGILDAAFNSVMELKRDDAQVSEFWLARWRDAITGTLKDLNVSASLDGERLRQGQVALGCALGYIEFRLSDINWRDTCPELSAWYECVRQRESFTSTDPSLPA